MPALQHCRLQNAWVRWIHLQFNVPGTLATEEHLLPAGAAIPRSKDAPLRIGAVGMAEGGNVDEVRIAWVDANLGDVSRLGKPQMAPRAARVIGAIDAVPVRDVATNVRLTHAREQDVGVGVGHRQRANGTGSEVAVRDVLPEATTIVGFPDATRAMAEVEHLWIGRVTRHGGDTAAAMWTD